MQTNFENTFLVINGIDFDKKLDEVRVELHLKIDCRRWSMGFNFVGISEKDIEYLNDIIRLRRIIEDLFGIPLV